MAAPTITAITPSSGPAHTRVVITGTGFYNPVVDFNGVPAQYVVDSPTQLTVLSPIGATGPIHVVTAGGTAQTTFTATNTTFPVISSFTIIEGIAGDAIVIRGTNFTGTTAVKFNGTSATFTINSSTQITATIPLGATTGKIAITNAAGTTNSTDNFYIPTVSPISALAGSIVRFAWTYSVSFEPLISGFKLQSASTSNGPWADVTSYAANVRSGSFTAPAVGAYSYRVAAYNSTTNQIRSSTIIYRLTVVSAEPVAPTLTSVSAPNPTTIVWNNTNVANETGYEYQTSFNQSTWTARGTSGADNVAFTWAGATASTLYYMRVASIGSSGTRYPSNVLNVTTPSVPPPEPVAPTLQSFVASSPTSLVWTHNDVSNETAYEYFTSPDNVVWTFRGSNVPGVTTFTWSGATASTLYYGRVSSVGQSGTRYPSNSLSVTTPAFEPVAPTLNSVSAPSSFSITWNHTNVANETGYQYETSPNGTNTWSVRGTAPANTTTFTWNGATQSTLYYMRVGSIGQSGTVYYSNVLNTTTPATAPPEPVAPVLSSFTSPSDSSLTWVNTNVANETGYNYETSPNGTTNWTVRGTVAVDVTTFTWTGASPATLYYGRCSSIGPSGTTYPSNVLNVTTAPAQPVAPVLSSVSAPDSMSLTWNHNNVANELSYQYETSADGLTNWVVQTTSPANSTTATWAGATPSTLYYMRVGAVGSSSIAESNILSTTTPSTPPPPPPPEPTAPTLASFTSPTDSSLAWSHSNVSNETGYDYETSPDQGTWTLRGTNAANVTTFTWTGASTGTFYYGRVSSFGPAGTRYPSNILSVTTGPTEPAAPVLTSAQALDSTHLQWTNTNVTNELGYSYETSPDNSTWTQQGTGPVDNTTFTWPGASPLTTYYMRVQSIGPSANHPSNVIQVTTPDNPPIEPAAPALTFFAASSDTTLVWSYTNVSNEVGYDFETSPDNATWTLRGSTAADTTSFTWGGASPSTLYYGRVSSFGTSGTRHPSNSLSATTPASPVEPTAPTLTNVSANSSTSITWINTDVSDEIGYQYETSSNGSTNWIIRGSAPPDTTSFTWTSASPNTLYYMRVSSVGNVSTYPSNVLNVTTPAIIVEPSAPVLTQITATNSTLTWTNTNVSDETGYNYEYSFDNVNWNIAGSAAAENTFFSWPNAQPNTRYYMRVSSFSSSAILHPSNVLLVKTPVRDGKIVVVKLVTGNRLHK